MNNQANFVILLCLTAASAGVVPLSARYLEGPSTKTRLVGPDGSVIEAFLPGGKVLLGDNVGGPLVPVAPIVLATPAVAQPEPAVPVVIKSLENAVPVVPVVPVLRLSDPVPAFVATQVASDAIPAVKIEGLSAQEPAAQVASDDISAVKVEGLSAQEPAVKSVDVPAPVVAGRSSENAVEEVTGTTESIAEELSTQASDESGEYVPDNSEKLYDDGSYKLEHQS